MSSISSSNMLASILAVVLVHLTWRISTRTIRWRRDYKLARTIGFPTFVSPVHLGDAWWMILYPILLPILEKLPQTWTTTWLSISKVWRLWKTGYLPFEEAGADTFLLSTPNGNTLWTCDHAVIHDLLVQHPKVQVPVDLVGFYDVWGPTIGSVEDDEWKAHRKAISAGFGNSMNEVVWREAQRQTQGLVRHWVTNKDATVAVMRDWTSRLALHVISCGFFNMQLDWDEPEEALSAGDSPQQTRLAFDQALILLLRRLSTVFMTPRALLAKLPFRMFREASLALSETEKYILKQRAAAEAEIDNIMKKRNPSLLESIVASGRDPDITNRSPFMEKSVLGNMFFTLMAGHETVGSSLSFIFIFATLYPEVQRKIQDQLDAQLGDRSVEQWTLERDYAALHKGYVGAVQREILTIYHPASFLLRRAVEATTVTDSNGMAHTIPAGTLTMLNLSAAFKNPKYWKKQTSTTVVGDSPARYFNPDRWIGDDGQVKDTYHLRDTKRTVPDHWAFGQGPRMCPGKAFAQIETTAAMATLFRDYSLELIVDDAIKAECGGDVDLAWATTRERALRMLYDDIEANITITLPSELPIKVVKRKR